MDATLTCLDMPRSGISWIWPVEAACSMRRLGRPVRSGASLAGASKTMREHELGGVWGSNSFYVRLRRVIYQLGAGHSEVWRNP
eukprot:3875426-Pyramimonas_sp.AAC.1